MQADLLPEGKHASTDGTSNFEQFWINVGILFGNKKAEAIIIITMLFTLVVWVISMISLIVALVLYLLFLWHHIPSSDGRLGIYCRRKIDKRLDRIASIKVKKAVAKQEMLRRIEEEKAYRIGGGPKPASIRLPTLPSVAGDDDILSSVTSLSRKTSSTLSEDNALSSMAKAGSQRQPRLSPLGLPRTPAPPSRNATYSSTASTESFASDAPLMHKAQPLAYVQPPMFRASSTQTQYGSTARLSRGMSRAGTPQSSSMDEQTPQQWNSHVENPTASRELDYGDYVLSPLDYSSYDPFIDRCPVSPISCTGTATSNVSRPAPVHQTSSPPRSHTPSQAGGYIAYNPYGQFSPYGQGVPGSRSFSTSPPPVPALSYPRPPMRNMSMPVRTTSPAGVSSRSDQEDIRAHNAPLPLFAAHARPTATVRTTAPFPRPSTAGPYAPRP